MIYKIDPVTGDITHAVPCELVRTCLDFDGENLWQIAGKPKRIRIIRPVDGACVVEINFESDTESVCALHVGHEKYWVGSKARGIVEERDRTQHRVLRQWETMVLG